MSGRLGARRLGLGIADQALSSGSNFLLVVLVARSAAPEEFGAFAVAWTAYWICLGTTRAVVCEPLLIRYARLEPARWRVVAARGAGVALLLGAGLSLICALTGVLLQGAVGPWLLSLAVVLPGLLVQDVWRAAFFARSEPRRAVVNDLTWILLFLPGAALVEVGAVASGPAAMLLWGGAGYAAALLGAWQVGAVPALASPLGWWNRTRPLAARLAAEFATLGLASQLAIYAVASIGGLAAAGAFRGAQSLLGPLNVLFTGLLFTLVPHGVDVARSSPRAVARLAHRVSASCAVAALGLGIGLWFLPERAGEEILGAVWPLAREIILPVSLAFAFSGVVFGATTGLRSLADARRSLRARVFVAPLTVLGAAVGAGFGPFAAAVGLAAAGLIAAAVWSRALSLSVSSLERGGPGSRRGGTSFLAKAGPSPGRPHAAGTD